MINEEELLKDGQLISAAEPLTDEDLIPSITPEDPNQITPTNTTGTKFQSAFGKKYGYSSVDLSIQDNEDKMLDEYNTWWRLPQSDERDKLREDFNQKYYNMSTEQLKEQNSQPSAVETFNDYTGDAVKGIAAIGKGGLDFMFDAIGSIKPLSKVDDWWDANTKWENPAHQQITKISSILLPAIVGGNLSNQAASRLFPQATKAFTSPWFKRLGATLLANGIADTAIVGLSDTSEEKT